MYVCVLICSWQPSFLSLLNAEMNLSHQLQVFLVYFTDGKIEAWKASGKLQEQGVKLC